MATPAVATGKTSSAEGFTSIATSVNSPPAKPKTVKGPDKHAVYLAAPITLDETILRQAILDSAAVFLGMTEQHNNNDAPFITKINRYNGLPIRSAYCASGYYYAHRINGVKLPVKALGSVASYFTVSSRIIWRRNQRGNQRIGIKPRRMDAVSIYASHVEGIVDDVWSEDDDEVKTIGFNTSGGRGTKYGCWINRRKKSEIKYIANWLTPYLETLK